MPGKIFLPVTVLTQTGYSNPLFLKADPRLLHLAQKAAKLTNFQTIKTEKDFRKPKVRTGIILTGDIFVASEWKKKQLRKRFNGSVVEMEGAAVAQVCYQNHVPHIVIRSASDSGNKDVAKDFHQFYKVAAQNSAKQVIKMIELLKKKENITRK